jgi:hypothetical protein
MTARNLVQRLTKRCAKSLFRRGLDEGNRPRTSTFPQFVAHRYRRGPAKFMASCLVMEGPESVGGLERQEDGLFPPNRPATYGHERLHRVPKTAADFPSRCSYRGDNKTFAS